MYSAAVPHASFLLSSMPLKQPGRTFAVTVAVLVSLSLVALGARRGDAAARHAVARLVADSGASNGARSRASRSAPIERLVDDSLRGRSGKLFMRLVEASRSAGNLGAFFRIFGDSTHVLPGVYPVRDTALLEPFAFIALRPFSDKRGASLGAYRIGFWPGEERPIAAGAYRNPAGFIEVTRDNENLRVSEHFRLRDFLTHDQTNVWPKYVVLREALVDKLELVITELERTGTPVEHMSVMSGFRTPQYNANGGETSGRAGMSRHMYGDAADVFVDNDGDGRMDDLNHDGRVDSRDAQVIIRAEERVERGHPDLTGGGGVYRATTVHGPFAHIDARGYRARWGRAG